MADLPIKVRGQDAHRFPRYARVMSSQTLPRPRKATAQRKKKSTGASGLMAWCPLVAGIAITFFSVKTAEILPLMGADGLLKLQLLYPFALLLKQPLLGLSEQTSESWSQIMLYAQYPLYGLYTMVATRWKPLWKVLLQVVCFHLLGFVVLWLLARK
jgi:hypothetical protein